MPTCNLCSKDISSKIHAVAELVCEHGHNVSVHQRCFDKAIEKAIRVRSTRSTAFENIARSTTHNWKTQKCAYPDCVKWLSEYTQHDPEDPAAAAAALYDNPAKVMVKVKSRAFEDEEEDEEENSDQCTALKVDATRCNFKKSDLALGLCRRCAEKHHKQAALTQQMQEAEREREEAEEGPKKDEKKAREKKTVKAPKSNAGLNSMLKSLAKAPDPKAPNDKPAASPLKRAVSAPAPPNEKPSDAHPSPWVAAAPDREPPASALSAWPGPRPKELGKEAAPKDAQEAPKELQGNEVSTEAELVMAVKGFVGQHARTTPREIARFLGTLPGVLPGGASASAIEVMRSRFHKLRNLLEAHSSTFVIHDPTDAAEYEVSLKRNTTPVLSAVDILSMMMPKLAKPLPARVEEVLDALNLSHYTGAFLEQEFMPQDLFFASDDDLKDLGLPVGPRVKLRTWIRAQVAPSGA